MRAYLSAPNRGLLRPRFRHQSLALSLLARDLPSSANCFAFLARPLLGWLFIRPPALHLAENAFALKLFLQGSKGLVDVVFANENYQSGLLSKSASWISGIRASALEPKLRTPRFRTFGSAGAGSNHEGIDRRNAAHAEMRAPASGNQTLGNRRMVEFGTIVRGA